MRVVTDHAIVSDWIFDDLAIPSFLARIVKATEVRGWLAGGEMNIDQFFMPLVGGVLIGLSASLLLLLKGRIFGVSGILAGVLIPKAGDTAWRVAALGGLVTAGILLLMVRPASMAVVSVGSHWRYIAAGLLVGFGTQLGSGCTSGHGVCGISRLSPRSIAATFTFIAAGIMMVALMRAIGVLS